MKDYKKIKKILSKMKRGLSYEDFRSIKRHSSDRTKVLKLFQDNKIEFDKIQGKGVYNYSLVLKTPLEKAYKILNELEDKDFYSIATRYDFTQLLNEMKLKLLTPQECCSIIGCSRVQFVNIVTYLTMQYPIYEEDDKRLGILTI